MTSPYFPSVDPSTLTVREQHIPARLAPSALTETIQDTAAGQLTGGTHSGVSFAYNDTTGLVNATVAAQSDLVAQNLARSDLLAADTFTRPDSATPGNAETGQAWELWSGTAPITSGKMAPTAANIAVIDVGRADIDASVEIIPQAATAASLVFRSAASANDRLAVAVDMTNGLRLNKVDTGATTALATFARSFTAGTTYTVRVVAISDVVTCYVDGIQQLTYTLTSGELTKYGVLTRVGIRHNASVTGVSFDNLRVALPPVGGTGGTSTTAVPLTTVDVKGDLIVASGSDAVGRLPVGANGLVPQADSTQALGLAYLGYAVVLTTGDDSDLAAALAAAPASAQLIAVKVAGT